MTASDYHPAIAANLTSDGYDFVNARDSLILCTGDTVTNAGDGDGYDPDPSIPAEYTPDATGSCFLPEDFGHGVHTAGTIGGVGNDAIGVTGVNWTVRIRPVRFIGTAGFGDLYDEAQAILYAAGLPADDGAGGTVKPSSGARIINMSFGGSDSGPTEHNAIISAASAGALLVASAGNDATSDPQYPAAYPEVLAVAAVGPDGAPTPYSNFGSYVAIRAPGGNLGLGDATDLVFSTAWDFTHSRPAYAFAVPSHQLCRGPRESVRRGTGERVQQLDPESRPADAALRAPLLRNHRSHRPNRARASGGGIRVQ